MGRGSIFTAHRGSQGPAKFRSVDYVERQGFMRGVIQDIVHDKGRGAPLAKVQFKSCRRFERENEFFIATEGMYTGQSVYCGVKAELAIGNVLPLS